MANTNEQLGQQIFTDEETEALRSIAEAMEQLADAPPAAVAAPAPALDANPEGSAEAADDGDSMGRLAPAMRVSARRNLLELTGLFGLVALAEYFGNAGQIGGYGMHPHPYWLIVLPAAAARGSVAGLVAAGLATLLYGLGAYRAIQPDRLLDLVEIGILLEPLLFGFVSFFVGHFRDEFITTHRELWRRFRHLQEINGHLLEHNGVLTEANSGFKARLLDHSAQFGNLIDIARRLDTASTKEIFELTLRMVRDHCGALECSVLLRQDEGRLELAAEEGWEPTQIRSRMRETVESPLVREVLHSGIRINGLEPDAPAPGPGPLIVAPLFDGEMQMRALICLDRLPVERVSQSTASLFFSIADWAESSLSQLANGESPASEQQEILLRPKPWLGEPDDLGRQIAVEDARCTRLGLVASVIAVRVQSAHGDGPDAMEALDDHILHCLGAIVRATDTLFRFGYPGCYAVLLAGTNEEGAGVFSERLGKWLDHLGADEIADYTVCAFHPTEEAPNLRMILNEVSKWFCQSGPEGMDRRCPVPVPPDLTMEGVQAFVRRMRLEMGLSMRYKHELYVVYFVLDETAGPLESFGAHLFKHARRSLRPTDGIFEFGGNRFAVVLPGATAQGAFGIAADFSDELFRHIPEDRQDDVRSEVFAAQGGKAEMKHLLGMLLDLTGGDGS